MKAMLWLLLLWFSQSAGPSPDAVVAELIAASTAAERQALLAANRAILDPALVSAIQKAGNAHYARNEFDEARRIYAVAGEVAERVHDVRGLAMSRSNTGSALMQQGREEEASAALLQSLEGFAAAGDHATASRTWNNLGLIRLHADDFTGSEKAYENALVEDDATGQSGARLITLLDMGNLYNFWCKYDLAAARLSQALVIAREKKDDLAIALIQATIAGTYFGLRDYALALSAAEESLKLKRQLNSHQMVSNVLDQIGQLHVTLGHPEMARTVFEQALTEADERHELPSRANILCDYGYLLWWKLHDNPGAIRQFEEALKIATDLGRKPLAHEARVGLAQLAVAESRWQDAVEWGRPALEFGRQTQDFSLIETAGDPLGAALFALGRKEEAEAAWRDCIAAIENQQEHTAGAQETRAQFMNDRQGPYARLSNLLQSEGRTAEALAIVEKRKARVILETLRNGNVEVDGIMTPDERKQEAALRVRIATLRTRGAAAPLVQARNTYRDFRNALYATHPELRVQRLDIEPVTPAELVDTLPDRDAALLEYVTGEGPVRFFCVTRGSKGPEVSSYIVAGKPADIAARVNRFRLQVATRDLAFRELARSLYADLLGPAAAQLRGKHTLVIVPDGFLWGLPFQALEPRPDRFLVEDHPVFYAPSLTVLHAVTRSERERPARSGSVLAAGGQDTAGLREIYGADRTGVYAANAAEWRRMGEAAKRYDVLHISAHGVFRDDDPMSSYLQLGAADRIEARDILNLSLHGRLVVLAACETARVDATGGEGLLGMSWAFFVAGSPATVASQFKVDAAATSELMLHFHRHLHTEGHAAQSLRLAALEVMQRPEYRHPFYWSGFLVMGYGF